eukprot:459896-Pelagomonas_calceolata.AAC.1
MCKETWRKALGECSLSENRDEVFRGPPTPHFQPDLKTFSPTLTQPDHQWTPCFLQRCQNIAALHILGGVRPGRLRQVSCEAPPKWPSKDTLRECMMIRRRVLSLPYWTPRKEKKNYMGRENPPYANYGTHSNQGLILNANFSLIAKDSPSLPLGAPLLRQDLLNRRAAWVKCMSKRQWQVSHEGEG